MSLSPVLAPLTVLVVVVDRAVEDVVVTVVVNVGEEELGKVDVV